MGEVVSLPGGVAGHTSMPAGWSVALDGRSYSREVMYGHRVAKLRAWRVSGRGWIPVLPGGIEGPVFHWADDACAWAERTYCGCVVRR